jgi:acetyl esterase/lipase
MNLAARRALVALSVVLVPLAVLHSARILTALMNATAAPFAYVRHPDIAYGDSPSHRLDVYVPNGAAHVPVVIFWHGGMWMQGSKDDVRFVGAALADSGYVAVIPNYRLHPNAQFPDFMEDGARAVAWARRESGRFGGNADAIFLMGHSAGAYIATMLAFDDRFLRSQGESVDCLRGVIGLAGPYTLERPAAFLDSIFGKPRQASWRPIDLASAAAPPTLLLHGEADDIIWVGEAQALADRLAAQAVPVEFNAYSDGSHQDLLIAWWRLLQFRAPVRADTRRFIDREAADGGPRPSCKS